MSIIDALILGLIQGLSEFIPVSSSGHLILADKLGGLDSSFAFDVVLNAGTLLALLVYYRRQIADLAKNVISGRDRRLARNIVISTIPAVVIGGLFTDLFAGDDVRSLHIVITMAIIIGLLMIGFDRLKGVGEIKGLSGKNALVIGLGQALALIPGTSRSGATILSGRLTGLSYRAAADYSFLIAIPVVFGALIRALLEPEAADLLQNHPGAVAAGVIASAISGWLAISFMISFLKSHGLKLFGIYRIVLGVGLLLLVK